MTHPTDPTKTLAAHGIQLIIEHKRVKNINFRLKPNALYVSAPTFVDMHTLTQSINQRLPWVVHQHKKLITKQRQTHHRLQLWGQPHEFADDNEHLNVYRRTLVERIPTLQAIWQPIVGQSADEVLVKKMHTRWGSCNVKARRVWLSVYLAAYPYSCTEYVFVHELCHLHHANHSPQFWSCVKKAMPDYLRWHGLLKSQL